MSPGSIGVMMLADPCLQSPVAGTRRRHGFVLGLFFLSGACALVYEVSWTRMLTLHFGSTALAVSTVLTVYMAGLAVGARLAGRYADRLEFPLTVYGLLELALAGYALLTPSLFGMALLPLGDAASALAESFWGLSIFRFAVASALLLAPTVIMGATLPILVRSQVIGGRHAGRWAGLLYGVNTAGAFAGTVLAGFVLLPGTGLQWTLLIAGCVNALVGGLAWGVGRVTERRGVIAAPAVPSQHRDASRGGERTPFSLCAALALSGTAAMVCEVTWTRVLTLVVGGSAYAFTIMLATFLIGLGIGATVVSAVLRSSPAVARTMFALLALATGAVIAVSSAAFSSLPEFFHHAYFSWQLADQPQHVIWVQSMIAAIVVLPSAVMMGGLFPAAARAAIADARTAGSASGRLYSWNTVGNIAGSFAAGFVLVPLFGIRATLLAAVTCEVSAAVIAGSVPIARRRTAMVTACAVVLLVGSMWLMPRWRTELMTSAIYAYPYAHPSGGVEQTVARRRELLYYRDGLSATVTVTRDRQSAQRDLYIAVNGKIDGSSHVDMPTQRLLAHLPLLFHPAPHRVAVIGMGTGCTAASAALHPVDQVDVVEIESAVVEGARLFRLHNQAVHENPRVKIHVTDGRLFLRLHPKSFDAVISEPSNPWLAGSSDLFTAELFALGARALAPGGIFAQWVQLYGLSPTNLRTVVRTFASVFPYVYLASTIPDMDILLLGTREPLIMDVDRARRRLADPAISADLRDPRVGIRSVADLVARFLMGPADVRRLAGSGPLHTDDLPILTYRAPLDLYRSTLAANRSLLSTHTTGIAEYLIVLPSESVTRAGFLGRVMDSRRAFWGG